MEVLLWNTYFGWIFQGRMKNFVSARRVLFELGFWENLFFLKTEIKGSYLLQKTFSWEVYKKMQNVSLKNPLHWGGRQQLFLTAVVFKGNFFQWKKYQTALLKLYFLLLVNFSFLPYLGHPVTTQNPKTLPLPPPPPKDMQTSLMNKFQACHETWTQGRFPGFSFHSDVAHGSGSEDHFSLGAGMRNPIV